MNKVIDDALNPPKRRDDILVSVCFSELPVSPDTQPALRAVAQRLDENFKFWEILLVVEASDTVHSNIKSFGVSNLRLLKVRTGTSTYRARVISAGEAIGDVVALTTPAEAEAFDLVGMINTAHSTSSIMTGKRDKTSLLDPLLRSMGAAGGFRVSTADMHTTAYPRTLLNLLLSHPDKELALRFAPHNATIPVQSVRENKPIEARSMRGFGNRLSLIQKLLLSIAPRVLGSVALVSSFAVLSAILYSLYAIGVWLIKTEIQPGWFTTSIVLSLTVAFLGTAFFGLSVGMQKIIDLLTPDVAQGVLDEQSTVDLFDDVMKDLNVEFDSSESQQINRQVD